MGGGGGYHHIARGTLCVGTTPLRYSGSREDSATGPSSNQRVRPILATTAHAGSACQRHGILGNFLSHNMYTILEGSLYDEVDHVHKNSNPVPAGM